MRYGLLYSVLSVTSWLASLSVILLCIWIVSSGFRRSTNKKYEQGAIEPEHMPIAQPQGRRTVWISTLTLLIGLGLGYAAHNWQFSHNRYLYTDVLVLERHDAQNFTIQPARMQPWHAHTCTPVDWQPFEKMRLLMFQQLSNCKEVGRRGAFEFYEQQGKRLLFPQEITNVRVQEAAAR